MAAVAGCSERTLRLTRGQRLIWAGQQLHPDVPLYNMAFLFTIDGPVDPALFRRAFGELVRRCDALRTVVGSKDGEPRQRIRAAADPSAADGHQDLDLSLETDPDAAARDWAQRRCAMPFTMAQRLYDSALLTLSADRRAWFFNQHHMVCDAWSVSILFDQLSGIYAALAAGQPLPGDDLPPYDDYVAFEADDAARQSATDYWRQSTARPPAPAPMYGGAGARAPATDSVRVTLEAGAERSRRLAQLARTPGFQTLSADLAQFNLFATVQLAWLHRVSGQQRLALGAPAHNRPTSAFKQTVGLFTEVYPLHVEVDADDSFASLYQKVLLRSFDFLKHAVPGAGSPGGNAGCNTVLNYLTATYTEFAGLPVQPLWLHAGHKDREHHLRLQVHDFNASGAYTLYFDFNAGVFDAARRAAAVAHFTRLLDAMLDDPSQPISAVDLLTGEELDRQVVIFNATELPADDADNVLRRFEALAASRPDAPALVAGERTVSYAELNTLAHGMAHELAHEPDRALTEAPTAPPEGDGGIVGVCTRRSIESIVGFLAVLKAGRTFLPLDPGWPDDRIAMVIEDAGADVVLLQPGVTVALPAGVKTVVIDADPVSPAAVPGSAAALRADQPAYVLYTSGSTGKPKGVVISHRALANYIGWGAGFYGRQLAWPLFTPLTFDLTVTSIFVPLTTGGSIVIYPQAGTGADLALLDVIEDDLTDIIKLTPSHLALLQGRDLGGSRVKQLILGGEDLTVDLARRTMAAFGGDVAIHNEYGPTEGTVGCIVHTYDPDTDVAGSVPIGHPITNMQAYVLDAHGRPVPAGVAGDLYIGGIGLAAGYLNRPALTAERFAEHPGLDGQRLYRTGDLARFGDHGGLDYLRRSDDQVKIRGARVELGEIENVIASQPGVKACAVTTFSREPAQQAVEDVVHCRRCGLPSSYPGAEFDDALVCNQCRAFERYRDRAARYFRTMADLEAIFSGSSRADDDAYDCIVLLSGGKDSTYMLCRLVDMGLKILAFTLDNGYISEQTKANIRRVVDALGVDHLFGATPAMNEIFVDSLHRHANVCQGCFKTIYTLSMNLARERGIPFIVTGLSRGQFFETRLTEEVFTTPGYDADRIDAAVLDARKAYHRVNDAVSRLLDVEIFDDDAIFEQVRFIDFYRYCPVDLDEMLAYLDRRVAWVRPSDTGRSTNCRINDVGIFIHKQQRGYHNYALPYSWDVRMGVKTRDAALAELDDDIDIGNVERILGELGYDAQAGRPAGEKRLAAYYTSDGEISASELRARVAAALPDFMMPSYFVELDKIPLSANGKVDRDALPPPDAERPALGVSYAPPRTPGERRLAEVWREVLRIDQVGIDDNFFELGGDSIMAIQIIARARRFGLQMTPSQLVDRPTIRQLALVLNEFEADEGAEEASGAVALTPMAHWLFEQPGAVVGHWNQVLRFRLERPLPRALLEQALGMLIAQHPALRTAYQRTGRDWQARVVADPPGFALHEVTLPAAAGPAERDASVNAAEAALHARIDLASGALVAGALAGGGDAGPELLLAIHHLAVDVVSWGVLLEDLASAIDALARGEDVAMPPRPATPARWAAELARVTGAGAFDAELPYWRDALARQPAPAPSAPAGAGPASPAGVTRRLPAATTAALLQRVPASGKVSVAELLAAALCRTLAISGATPEYARRVPLYLEGHGRNVAGVQLDVSSTVGWLTSVYPVTIDVPAGAEAPGFSADGADPQQAGDWLKTIKAQLRQVPGGGVGYGLLRYLAPDAALRAQLAGVENNAVLFNYLGSAERMAPAGAPFAISRALTLSRAAGARHRYRFEVNVAVIENELEVDFCCAAGAAEPAGADALAAAFLESVRILVAACLDDGGIAPSASDFPLANLDDDKFDKLAALLDRNK